MTSAVGPLFKPTDRDTTSIRAEGELQDACSYILLCEQRPHHLTLGEAKEEENMPLLPIVSVALKEVKEEGGSAHLGWWWREVGGEPAALKCKTPPY